MLPLLSLGLVLAANPYLDEGQKLFEGLRYPEAEARLKTARQVPTSTPEERRRVYDLLARSVAAQGRMGETEGLYAELLAKDPDAPPPQGVSPKIREAYTRAKERVYPPPYAQLTLLPAAPGRLELSLVDPWQEVTRVVLATSEGTSPFVETALPPRGRQYESALPHAPAGLRYYVEARSAQGKVLASLGTQAAPLRAAQAGPAAAVTLTPEQPAPAGPARWPAWVVGGATVAALATGVAMAVSASSDDARAHTSTEARDARALSASAQGKAVAANILVGAAIVGGAGTALLVWRW